MPGMSGFEARVDNPSAKVWFQESVEIARVIDVTDLEELNDDMIKRQLLR